jgi:hypothetical protein
MRSTEELSPIGVSLVVDSAPELFDPIAEGLRRVWAPSPNDAEEKLWESLIE